MFGCRCKDLVGSCIGSAEFWSSSSLSWPLALESDGSTRKSTSVSTRLCRDISETTLSESSWIAGAPCSIRNWKSSENLMVRCKRTRKWEMPVPGPFRQSIRWIRVDIGLAVEIKKILAVMPFWRAKIQTSRFLGAVKRVWVERKARNPV